MRLIDLLEPGDRDANPDDLLLRDPPTMSQGALRAACWAALVGAACWAVLWWIFG